MWNVKTFPTGKGEMNIQCQMPMGLLSICADTWLFFTKIATVKTIMSKLREELAFLLGFCNLHSVKASQLKLQSECLCFVSKLPFILINSSGIHLLSQQIFTESYQVSDTALDAGVQQRMKQREFLGGVSINKNRHVDTKW